jgi:hypothetical protein
LDVPDVKAFVDSPAKKPGDTMLCDGKLVRDKPMYRPIGGEAVAQLEDVDRRVLDELHAAEVVVETI